MPYRLLYEYPPGLSRVEEQDTWEDVAYRAPYVELVCGLPVTIEVSNGTNWSPLPKLIVSTNEETRPPFFPRAALPRLHTSEGKYIRITAENDAEAGTYYARTGGFIYALRLNQPIRTGERTRLAVRVVPAPTPIE